MEFTFSDLRSKEVVNTQDGRKLGRVCDVALCYPENRWLGIVVPGGNGVFRKKNEMFIDLRQIVKIGEDVILVNIGFPRGEKRGKNCPPSPPYAGCYGNGQGGAMGGPIGGQRNYEEFE